MVDLLDAISAGYAIHFSSCATQRETEARCAGADALTLKREALFFHELVDDLLAPVSVLA